MVTLGGMALLIGVIGNNYQDDVGVIVVAAIPYGFVTINFVYLLTFFFKQARGVIFFFIGSFLFVVFIAAVISVFGILTEFCNYVQTYDSTYSCTKYQWAIALSWILRIFPPYYITDAMLVIAVGRMFQNMGGVFGANFNPFADLYSFDIMGKRFLEAALSGVVYFIIVILLERWDQKIRIKCCKKRVAAAPSPFRVIDPDVTIEEARVFQNPNLQDPLIIKGLSKTFKGQTIPAVAGITFSVPRSQCFGLLGINGAGKTTTFKMLTGYLRATDGEAQLTGRNLMARGWDRLAGASYCPQENTLFESLTARQHLELFSQIRGIPRSHMKQVIDCLVDEVGLRSHLSKRASQLSGGNQRKLQFALSLLDYSPIIFLDEPTTGMDPGARRNAWNGIQRAVDRGCSVILTSHSMEECEALCHRLVIMVAGAFQCIGSVQYLKDKFGSKYTFKLKVSSSSASAEGAPPPLEAVCNFIKGKFHDVVVMEQHTTVIHFEIPATNLRLSELFTVLSECRNQFPIEDFTVSQTTLEQVFINMAQVQELLQSGNLVALQMQQQQQNPQTMMPPPPPEGTVNPVFMDETKPEMGEKTEGR